MRSNVRWRVCILSLLGPMLLFASGPSYAWTLSGHRVAIEIAIRDLTESAVHGIRSVLDRKPDELSDLAMYADDVAEERQETMAWHSVDIPHESAGYDRAGDCANDDCIVEKIKQFAHALADRRADKAVRAQALKFLIHLVGDIHVPLHAYAPGTREDLWRGWDGWEGPWVRIGDEVADLHTWWDWTFLAGLGGAASAIAARLTSEITSEERAAWRQGAPEDWANESFHLARTFVMRHGLIDRARLEGNSESNPLVLDAAALEEGQRIVAQRLKQAGVRLAALLNEAFRQASE